MLFFVNYMGIVACMAGLRTYRSVLGYALRHWRTVLLEKKGKSLITYQLLTFSCSPMPLITYPQDININKILISEFVIFFLYITGQKLRSVGIIA